MRTWSLLVIGAGCAKAPYRAEATMVENGKYMIRSAPDPEGSSEGLATQYAYRRANEVCSDGYDIVDNKVGSVTTTERVAVFGRRTTQSPEVVLMVRCK